MGTYSLKFVRYTDKTFAHMTTYTFPKEKTKKKHQMIYKTKYKMKLVKKPKENPLHTPIQSLFITILLFNTS